MEIQKTTVEDGRHCAAVINALNLAKFDGLTGKDMETLVAAKKWLHGLALQMAGQLKAQQAPSAPAPASDSFKIKSMGTLPAAKSSKRKK